MTEYQDSLLAEEVRLWNTPLFGAYLLWEFTNGYQEDHPSGEAPNGLLHFIATAILTSPQMSKYISSRRPNLQSFALGFEKHKNSDILSSLQTRIQNKKQYTLSSIKTAVALGLLSWETETGNLYPHKINIKPKRGTSLRTAVKSEGRKARVLGSWFSQHEASTIANYLRVEL